MSEQPKLGGFLDGSEQRDAIHIAIAPVVAAEHLQPGDAIGFAKDDTDRALVAHADVTHIGIVDPFLRSAVRPGQRVWMFLYPQTITSLRHDWTHPAFIGAPEIAGPAVESRRWIEAFASSIEQTYHRLMAAADEWVATDDGKWGGEYTYDNSESYKIDGADWEQFWKHYTVLTGRAPKSAQCFFTCSC